MLSWLDNRKWIKKMSEAPVVKNCMLEASRNNLRLFRNNRGQFYTMDKKRIVRAGLEAPGASDLIGVTPVIVTQEMVGMCMGLFTAAEVKEPDWKYTGTEHEEEQDNFHVQIRKLGGIGFFINNHSDLSNKIKNAIHDKIVQFKLGHV